MNRFGNIYKAEFTPEFNEFFEDLLEHYLSDDEAIKRPGDVTDKLLSRMLDNTDYLEAKTHNRPWLHLTLYAALLLNASEYEDRVNAEKVVGDADAFPYIREELMAWFQHRGSLGVWGSLQAATPDLKNRLYQEIYADLSPFWMETGLVSDEGHESSRVAPHYLARNVRLNAAGLLYHTQTLDEIQQPDYIKDFCTLEYILNVKPGKHAETVEFFNKLIATHESTDEDLYDYRGLVNEWFNDHVRTALIYGYDYERVIEGAAITLRAYSDFMGMQPEVARRFERQTLINAVMPFPQVLALLEPSRDEILVKTVDQYDTGLNPFHAFEGPFFNPCGYGAPDAGAAYVFSAMDSLGFKWSIEDLFELDTQCRLALLGLLGMRQGRCKEIEAWFAENLSILSSTQIRDMFGMFDVKSLDDETLLRINLHRVSEYVSDERMQVLRVVKAPLRAEHAPLLIDRLLNHEKFDRQAINVFGFSREDMLPFMSRMKPDTRRLLIETDLGL